MTRCAWIWIVAAMLITSAVHTAWLIAFVKHASDDDSARLIREVPLFLSHDPATFVKDYLSSSSYFTFRGGFMEKGLRLGILVLGLGGLRLVWRRDRPLGFVLSFAIALLLVVAYFGSFIPFLARWQPLRFKVMLDIFLLFPAACWIATAFSNRRGEGAVQSERHLRVPGLPLVILGIASLCFAFNVIRSELRGEMRMRTEIPPTIRQILDWVSTDTDPGVRILFEESGDETGFAYDGMYLSCFLPHWTGRELIGGPINLYNDRHHFAEFHSGRLLRRDIAGIPDDELWRVFETYNIGAVVAFSDRSLNRLFSVPNLVSLDRRVGRISLLKVKQIADWTVEGDAKVHAGLNRIDCSDVSGDRLVLKYHWIEGLRSEPSFPIDQVNLGADPIPFILINRPPSQFTLRVR